MNILLTSHSKEYQALADLTLPSKLEYCMKWNCALVAKYHRSGVDIAWDRPRIWLETLERCDWLFFTGADVAITNFDTPMLPRQPGDFFFAVDHNGLQSDSWIMRNCGATQDFLRSVIAAENRFTNEQDAMQVLLSSEPDYERFRQRIDARHNEFRNTVFQQELNRSKVHCQIVPRKLLNAYPAKFYPVCPEDAWDETSMCLHLPGMSLERRLEIFPRYLKATK